MIEKNKQRKPRQNPQERARKKTQNYVNQILRAFDGLIAQSSLLRPDQRTAALEVLDPAINRAGEALLNPPASGTGSAFVLPE